MHPMKRDNLIKTSQQDHILHVLSKKTWDLK